MDDRRIMALAAAAADDPIDPIAVGVTAAVVIVFVAAVVAAIVAQSV